MKRRQPKAEIQPKKKCLSDNDDAIGPSIQILQIGTSLHKYLSSCVDVVSSANVSLEQIVNKSQEFVIPFPIQSVRCCEIMKQNDVTHGQLQHHINSAYPVLHESALSLYTSFLEHKKSNGTATEKQVYSNMGLIDLVQRFLEKRAVSFLGKKDKYLLLNGKKGTGGWEIVGKDNEKSPLILSNCLSYDEMKLSVFLSLSSYSVFINDGNRKNRGEAMLPEDLRRHGVIIGLIGTRLSRPDYMEWQEIVVTKSQNVVSNAYGTRDQTGLTSVQKIAFNWRQLWSQFYEVTHLPLYDDVTDKVEVKVKPDQTRYVQLPKNVGIFDNLMFKKRLSVSIDTLLLEAEYRALQENTTAYIHVVGIGLGVWKASKHQEKVFLAAFAECIKRLQERISHVSDIYFGWFSETNCGGVPNGGKIGSGIQITFSKRPPHMKLPRTDDGKLLVVSYAWDSNAFPGNEFWLGKLSSSGDSAAACASQITELHNPIINSTKVCGSNLHIASPKWGVLHIAEYARRKLAECQPK